MDYAKEIVEVINYIEDHLFECNVYHEAYSRVYVSKYHFHRIFLASTMHTLGDYIRKRRFTEIARRLRETNDRIIDIAFDCNYESHEAFSRAFRNYFHISPYGYRKSNVVNSLMLVEPLSKGFIASIREKYNTVPSFEYLDCLKLKGYFFKTPTQNHKLLDYFKQFFSYLHMHSLKIMSQYAFTVWLSEKTNAKDLSDDEEYTVFVGSALEEKPCHGLQEIILKSNLYAAFKIEKEFKFIHEFYQYIFFEWLKKNNFELEKAPIIERYSRDFSIQHKTGYMWIMIPVKERQ